MDVGSIVSAGSSLIGGLMGDSDAEKSRKMQMDLAKNSIKYRVEDAKNSGIHPLYALGAQGLSANTVSSPMGQAVADAGNAVGKGISSNYEKELQAKNLENIQADINLKNAQATGYIAEAKNASNIARSGASTVGTNQNNVGKYMGHDIKANKNFMDAEEAEKRYGDIAQEVIGISNIVADLAENAGYMKGYKEKKKIYYNKDTMWR